MALTLESVCARARHGRVDGRGVPGDQPRLADGRPRQLGRHHVADPARLRRRVPRARRTSAPTTSRRALRQAADAAYQAVMRPVEGTILTVVREAAEAVESRARPAPRSSRCSSAAVNAARAAVLKTPDLLPVLREAGVVDAGGRGSRCCSMRCSRSSTGGRSPSPSIVDTPASRRGAPRAATTSRGSATRSCTSSTRPTTTIGGFKDAWSAIGDSIVVVGGDGIWNCHVHTNDIGAAIEAGIEAGRPHQIRVTDLFEQVEEERWVRRGRVSSTSMSRRPSRHDRGRRGRRRRRRAPAAQEPRRAACRRGRAVDEPVDRADPRSGRGVQRRRGDRAAEQQEHRAGRAAGRRAHREARRGRRRRRASRRPSPRWSTTTPNAELDANDGRRWRQRVDRVCAPAKSRRPCATRSPSADRSREGDWIALTREGGIVAAVAIAGRRGVHAARPPGRRRQ